MRSLKYLWVLLGVIACASPTTQYPEATQSEIINEKRTQEKIVKQQAKKEELPEEDTEEERIKDYYRLKRVGEQIQGAAQQLCDYEAFREYPCWFEFVVLLKDGVNAFADGDKIYVSMDMIRFADDDTELALVLGHEYAHNIMRHVRSQKTNTIFGTLLGAVADIATSTLTGVGTGSIFRRMGSRAGNLAYSKEFEKEADYIGLYITALASYPIENAANFWRKMSIKHPKAIYIATTHPTNPERYIGIKKAMKEIKEKERGGLPLIPNMRPKETKDTGKNKQ